MSGSEKHNETDGIDCDECESGTLRVADAVYADCDNCDAAVLRTELGI